jgi:hypothetical protein
MQDFYYIFQFIASNFASSMPNGIYSIMSLESALKNYRGAMIVISHDQNFLKNIGVERRICAPFLGMSR